MSKPAPALSLRQPWAELIVSGRKVMELRAWDTDYRGKIWLHAGRHLDPALDARFGIRDPPRGAFVGSVELRSIALIDPQRWVTWRSRHLDPGPYQPGYFAWNLANPRRLRAPVPASGQLRLFPVDQALLARLQDVEG